MAHMISTLLSLIPGSVWAYGAAALAAVLGVWRIYAAGKKSGRNEVKVDSYEEEMRALERANTARVGSLRQSASGGLHDDDGFKRQD